MSLFHSADEVTRDTVLGVILATEQRRRVVWTAGRVLIEDGSMHGIMTGDPAVRKLVLRRIRRILKTLVHDGVLTERGIQFNSGTTTEASYDFQPLPLGVLPEKMSFAPDMDEPDELSPLASALSIRDFEAAARLIENGACLDDLIGDDASKVPLHNAARSGDLEMVDFFLDHECPKTLEQFDYIQQTPLICAADNGKTDVVVRLLAAGADPNSHDEKRAGNTAIREAVRGGHREIVSLLLQAGADPTIPGWMHISAVDQAWYDIHGSHETIREIRAMLAKYPSSIRDRKIKP